MNLEIKKLEWIDGGLDAMIKQIALYKAKRIPPVIEAWMLLVPCLRILRAIFGCSNQEIPFKLQQYYDDYIMWLEKLDADDETRTNEQS